ncbi:MAG: bifunctional 5,10-methylenetetrahydrofolate dehydrogenase/5,10-methenyltetrahydrofolate cyclohydrolase [Pirellulales bacterium]|nr:bifunctional 5,10-methylenetetrahydrofolate dehydrogenase/5,10-methenyltetrahydrofolate cyclohydrolase [Pirellulales bacterium]
MTARILDGKACAAQIQAELAGQVAEFVTRTKVVPALDVVLVGENPASQVYVRNKALACEKVGMRGRLYTLPQSTTTAELLELIYRLNQPAADQPATHGILVQLPLPAHIDTTRVLDAIDPRKDVDAFHAENVGLLVQGRPRFLPCTPRGVLELCQRSGISLTGRRVVILGRSDIVGKPLANMLLQKGADATVTVCHSRTREVAWHTREAEILVAAIGQPRYVTAEMVRPGATVIDVGINRDAMGKLCGDVDFDAVQQVAGAITPVPGGVGPLTVAMLLLNTLTAAQLATNCTPLTP